MTSDRPLVREVRQTEERFLASDVFESGGRALLLGRHSRLTLAQVFQATVDP